MTNSASACISGENGNRSPASQPAAGLRVHCDLLRCVTTKRLEIIDVTSRVASAIRESGISSGLAQVQSLHTTTALSLNEFQAALLHDFEMLLRSLVDEMRGWRHNDPRYSDCDRGNAAAHLRSLLLGHSLVLQVRDGSPVLGKWQAVLLTELDGPQTRNLSVQVMGV